MEKSYKMQQIDMAGATTALDKITGQILLV
jgi:hypothetical protein